MLTDELKKVAKTVSADLKEKKGLYTLEYVVAERKAFLSKKKLTYIAKFRVDEGKKELRFTEMLKEAGSGVSMGGFDDDMTPGFGFKKETYKTGLGPREGTIEEQSKLFGKEYSYTFDFGKIRGLIEQEAAKAGYSFKYQLTPIGL